MNFENLTKESVNILFAGEFKYMKEVKALIRLPLDNENSELKNKISQFKIENEVYKYDKPILDLIYDIIIWGICKNEPLGISMKI